MTFHPILLAHAARYPAWQPQDVYKLAHQAALGSEHAVVNREHARAWLQRELASLTPGPPGLPDDPLIDPISVDGSIARVHLRPLARLGLSPDVLLDAFLRTAVEFHGSKETLRSYQQQVMALTADGSLSFSLDPLTRFFEEMTLSGYPAAHHSPAYTRTYHPAYRVAALSLLPENWLSLPEDLRGRVGEFHEPPLPGK